MNIKHVIRYITSFIRKKVIIHTTSVFITFFAEIHVSIQNTYPPYFLPMQITVLNQNKSYNLLTINFGIRSEKV